MKLIYLFLLIAVLCVSGFPQKIRICSEAKAENTTNWGHIANEDQEKIPIKRLYGAVNDPIGKPVYNALVEVFIDNGEIRTPTTPQNKRLIACITQIDGRFRFDCLKAGKYILAVGRAGFNITFIKLILEPKKRQSFSKSLNVKLEVGT